MICWNGQCRNPQCVEESDCSCEERIDSGFIIEKYEDIDGDANRDSNEPGLDWKFEWRRDEDNEWFAYETYDHNNGRGGRVGNLKSGDQIIIREIMQDGWYATTPQEVSITLEEKSTTTVRFGNKRSKPEVTAAPTPSTLPETGTPGEQAVAISLSFAMIGLGLTWLRSRLTA